MAALEPRWDWDTGTGTGKNYKRKIHFKLYHSKRETTSVVGGRRWQRDKWNLIHHFSVSCVLSAVLVLRWGPKAVRGTGQQRLRRWLWQCAGVSGIPALSHPRSCPGRAFPQGWSFPRAPVPPGTGPCRARTRPWFVLLASELEGLFHFCHPQYLMKSLIVYALCEEVLNKVLSSAASSDTALLSALEVVNSSGSLCTFCQLSPLQPLSLPGTEFPILVINHIKTLIQFVLPHFFLPVLMLFHPFWQRISFWQRGKLAHGVHWEFYVVLWVMVSPLFPQDNIVCDVGWSLTVAEHCFMVRPLTLQGSTSCGTSKGGDDFVCELRVVHPSWNTHRWTEHCSSASSACGAWVHL